ncbi:hypothetical protein KBY96_14140 [Cyanobium sp. ATX 6A2]|uniref:hypothetical protein n=1 Tax=Cyanobium sp. ATX 6A2 TaxID=2823700 RepID=UPI0020CC0945|nr:hypothetical protein [Cyanobium sp. ATX 6A2]MCP9889063.1 hypothetical protein [Cyanobium sp. ATX 6A2]
MSRTKKDTPPADYPQGPKTVTFEQLAEDDWWALLHALSVRIRFFEHQRSGYERLNDPGQQRHIDYCDDTLNRLRSLLHSAEEQIGAVYFRRHRREAEARQSLNY